MRYLHAAVRLLRQGEPVRDVLLYLPTTDAYARLGTATSLDLCKTLAGMVDPRPDRVAAHRRVRLRPARRRRRRAGRAHGRPGRAAAGPASRCPPRPEDWLDRVEAAGGRVLTVETDDDAATLVGRHLAPDLTPAAASGPTSAWCTAGSATSTCTWW